MTTLTELKALLDEAQEPKKEIDRLLYSLECGEVLHPDDFELFWGHRRFHYTSSIDAALALVGRKLPGWSIAIEKGRERSACRIRQDTGAEPYECTAPTPALAILKALVAALIEQGGA